MSPSHRSEAALRQRQARGELRVLTAAAYRALVQQEGLPAAYACTDVVVAADAGFTDQASLHLSLGPCDPPIRLRTVQLGGVAGLASGGGSDLVMPIGGAAGEREGPSGARLLGLLLAGTAVPLAAAGEGTPLHPRRELHTDLSLERIAAGRLVLHRGISENGVVAVSSAPELCHSPLGPLLGPFTTALYSSGGPGSIGLTMPGLHLLGPGSPVMVGGAIGWVMGSGSGHQPNPRRQASGHASTPGAVAAVAVDLHDLNPRWIRPSFFEGHGHALLVAIAAPVPLLNLTVASQAAAGAEVLEAPVIDLAIPRRVKPSLGSASYADLLAGRLPIGGRSLRCGPAHSPRLAEEMAENLVRRLVEGTFPLHLPSLGLSQRPALIPLDP